MRERLLLAGIPLLGEEPMKLTVAARPLGYTGCELAALLREEGIECEFSDPDYLVAMPSVATASEELLRFEDCLLRIPRRAPLAHRAPPYHVPTVRMTAREALLSPAESLPAAACLGRTLAVATVGCPPAVPILVSGEVVDEEALALFAYYGIPSLRVTK